MLTHLNQFLKPSHQTRMPCSCSPHPTKATGSLACQALAVPMNREPPQLGKRIHERGRNVGRGAKSVRCGAEIEHEQVG